MKIALIGCGWLGIPLAQELLTNGHAVFGSSTTIDKLSQLEQIGITPFLYDGENNNVTPELVRSVDCLVINFPPSKSGNYPKQIEELLKKFPDSCKVIFTSSTSVYCDVDGEIDENGELNKTSPVFLAEEIIIKSEKQTTILRLAGLIGPSRHPVNYMSGRKVQDGNMAINLVHLDDVIAGIKIILDKNAWGKLYNICWHEHPTKSKYYSKAATEMKLSLPVFEYSNKTGKIVSSKKIEQELDFQFRYSIYRIENE